MTAPFLLCAAITAISATVSLGFSLVAVRSSRTDARTLALYATARSAALTLASIAVFFLNSAKWLESIACCMIFIQACDAVIGVMISNRMKTFGPAFTAVFNLAALWWLTHPS